MVPSAAAALTAIAAAPSLPAHAALFSGPEPRQLELCLVAVQRVVYWSQSQADALRRTSNNNADDEQQKQRRKAKYLETRLGAKALLTGRVGGGPTGRVYMLASLQLPGCLQDLEWHASTAARKQQQPTSNNRSRNNAVADLRRTFSEGLASVVEFDGLETLLDPSPRSSLTLSAYNDGKAEYVRRALDELVVPSGQQLLRAFGPEPLERARGFVQQYYKSEIYPPPAPPTTEPQKLLKRHSE